MSNEDFFVVTSDRDLVRASSIDLTAVYEVPLSWCNLLSCVDLIVSYVGHSV